MGSSSIDWLSWSADRKVRLLLGRSYLRENRVGEALEIYQGILRDFPGDLDVLIIFGELYRLSGSPVTARGFFHAVLEQSPNYMLAVRQLRLVEEETALQGQTGEVEVDPLSAAALERLVNRLQNVTDEEKWAAIRGVADLLERVIAEANPPGTKGQPNAELQQLMPALINLNIRQARVTGQPELAEALQSLQFQLSKIISDQEE